MNILSRNYILNFFNAIFVFSISIFYYYWHSMAINFVDIYYRKSASFNIISYKRHYDLIFYVIILGFLALFLSVLFSRSFKYLKNIFEKYLFFALILIVLLFTAAQVRNYILISKDLLNYSNFYDITMFSGYYQYILMNFFSNLIICLLYMNAFQNFFKNKKAIIIFALVFYIFYIVFIKFSYFYSIKINPLINFFLIISNVNIALIEKSEFDKLKAK